MPWYLVIQITLLLMWYGVPALATVPAIVMLLPTVIVGAVIGGFVLFSLIALALAVIVS